MDSSLSIIAEIVHCKSVQITLDEDLGTTKIKLNFFEHASNLIVAMFHLEDPSADYIICKRQFCKHRERELISISPACIVPTHLALKTSYSTDLVPRKLNHGTPMTILCY